jgi:hypothetical protein
LGHIIKQKFEGGDLGQLCWPELARITTRESEMHILRARCVLFDLTPLQAKKFVGQITTRTGQAKPPFVGHLLPHITCNVKDCEHGFVLASAKEEEEE